MTGRWPMVRVAVGLDYETDNPWVYLDTDGKNGDDFGPTWVVRDVPAELANRFAKASEELDAAIRAVHDAAGYDTTMGRLREPCDAYEGEPTPGPEGRVWWDRCVRCAWYRDEHPAVTAAS